MKRREFMIALSGAAALWPFETSAQQPLLPIIGYMSSRSAGNSCVPCMQHFAKV